MKLGLLLTGILGFLVGCLTYEADRRRFLRSRRRVPFPLRFLSTLLSVVAPWVVVYSLLPSYAFVDEWLERPVFALGVGIQILAVTLLSSAGAIQTRRRRRPMSGKQLLAVYIVLTVWALLCTHLTYAEEQRLAPRLTVGGAALAIVVSFALSTKRIRATWNQRNRQAWLMLVWFLLTAVGVGLMWLAMVP